jgi:hypothetical protein
LVSDDTTNVAPRASGCCKYGVAVVLSTATRTFRSFAASTTARMSPISSDGLLGVSIHTRRAPSITAGCAQSSAEASRTSTPIDCSHVDASVRTA